MKNVVESYIPKVDNDFVPFGFYEKLVSVLESKLFFPTMIVGLSGNGKTYMIDQACAKIKREVIRVNFTSQTDEEDLIGGFRLVNGNTVYETGPVILAMKRGAVLLLDEFDLANPANILCLQSIMEGSGYFIKKTGEYVKPADGFTIIATANTKGQGDDTSKFIGTNVMNEAFLERFAITLVHDYPSEADERNILSKKFVTLGLNGEDPFIYYLTRWACDIRKAYMEGGEVEEIISTRRLVHAAKAYMIFNNRIETVKMITSRFDEDQQTAMIDFYNRIDDGSNGFSVDDFSDVSALNMEDEPEDDLPTEEELSNACPF
jgi:hypothetical protein